MIIIPPLPAPAFELVREGKDKLQVIVNAPALTRQQVYRLIGELERIASTL